MIVKGRRRGEEWETYADDALGADQLDQLVGVASLGVALPVCLEVAQVTDVALLVVGSTVRLVLGVDCSALVIISKTQVHRWWDRTHSGVQQTCSRWCCRRKRERACHAQHWHRCQ
jgi:hypothetical protein